MSAGKTREELIEMNKNCHVPRSETAKLRLRFNAVRTYPIPKGITTPIDPDAYRGDLIMNWIKSKSGKQLVEIVELENLANLLKGDDQKLIWKKLQNNRKLDKDDMTFIQLIIDLMEKLHRMKYGEKRVSVNTTFKDIREMMWGTKDVNPSGDGTELSGTERGREEEIAIKI